MLKFLPFSICLLLLFAISPLNAEQLTKNTAYLEFDWTEDQEQEYYFWFEVVDLTDELHTARVKLSELPVSMVNYACNVSHFNYLGIANTDVKWLENYYWIAKHDPNFTKYNIFKGSVNVLALWPGVGLKGHISKIPPPNRQVLPEFN